MSGGFVGGFVLGVVIGCPLGAAVAAAAMAKRGAEAIELVAQGAGHLRGRAGGLVEQMRTVTGEGNGPPAPAIEREIDEAADRVIYTAAGMQ